MSEQSLEPVPLPKSLQMVDTFMRPFMRTIGGFRPDSVQETHNWHVQKVNPDLVDPDLSATVKRNPAERLQSHQLFLFHIPILNGWKHYTLFEAAEEQFHIGWVARTRGKLVQAAVHRLMIDDLNVRMLNGPGESSTEFFAVKPNGMQIGVSVAGHGVLGDNQFPGTRLL